jgi:putative transposase
MVFTLERKRTSTIVIMYFLYLYFLGLSLRNTSKALVIFRDEKRSYMSVWNWIQKFTEYPICKHKMISAFIIDETVIQIGRQHFLVMVLYRINSSFSAGNLHI